MNVSVGKIDSSKIKLHNRESVFRYIWEQRQVSKQDIVTGLRLSLPTVTQNLNYLNRHGLIDASERITGTGGRNATAYSILGGAYYAIGVSLTSHHMVGLSINLLGEVGSVVRRRISLNLDSEDYLKEIGSLVEEVVERDHLEVGRLLGVGVSVPGLVSEDGEEVLYGKTFHFSGKKRAEICQYIPYPTRLFHDSYTAGYAEMCANPSLDRAFYISLNSSIGGALIENGQIYRGDSSRAGEVGHMILHPNSKKKCYCGCRGCFDTVCNSSVLDSYTGGNLEEFFQIKQSGDQGARRLWSQYLDDLSIAIHNIRMLLDVKIVLGGYVGVYLAEDYEGLYQRVERLSPFGEKAEDYLIPCMSQVECVAVGAGRIFVDTFLENILRGDDSEEGDVTEGEDTLARK